MTTQLKSVILGKTFLKGVNMTTASDFEQSCRDQITVLFLAEILNRLGVIAAGKVLTNVTKKLMQKKTKKLKRVY